MPSLSLKGRTLNLDLMDSMDSMDSMPSLSLKGWTLNLDLMGLKLVCVCISTLSTPWPGILGLLTSWLILGLLTSWLSRMCCMASSLGGSVIKEPPHLHQEVTLLSHRSPVMWYLTHCQ